MVLSRSVARFNRRATNQVIGRVAPWLPGFGVLTHVGRRSGRSYRTPLNVFRTPDGYVVALTYGPDADWVKNVLAAGECELTTRGRTIRLHQPRVVRDEERRAMPFVVRHILRLIDASDFLYLTKAS